MRPAKVERILMVAFLIVGVLAGLFAAPPLPRESAAAVPLALGSDSLRLVAAGDTLAHLPEVEGAWDPGTKSYDFRPYFADLAPLFSRADLAVAVLETNLGAEGARFSGYPRFNSPGAIADAMQWAGIDLVFTAHNHMLDLGREGLFATQEYLDRLGLDHVGSNLAADPAARVRFKLAGGIKLAFLSYTDLTNGLPVPAGCTWAVNLYTPEMMRLDVARARSGGAEIVVCAIHFGTEYRRQPDKRQLEVVENLLAAGVDLVLGSHPHAIQPVSWRTIHRADGAEREAFVAYSLGNLLSNQRQRYSDCGLLLEVTISRELWRAARIAQVQWQPVWVHRYRQGDLYRYRILPVGEDNAAVYATDPLLTAADRQRLAQVWEETKALIDGGLTQ